MTTREPSSDANAVHPPSSTPSLAAAPPRDDHATVPAASSAPVTVHPEARAHKRTAPSTSQLPGQPQALGLDSGDRRFVRVLACIVFVLLVVRWYQHTQFRPGPIRVERPPGGAYRFVLDLNTATWVEWMQVEGIGETLARRIAADRELHGPFVKVDDLDRVPGVGPKTLEAIRAYVVESTTDMMSERAQSTSSPHAE